MTRPRQTEVYRTLRRTSIDEVFPYQICINLDRRPDRWRQMQRKFNQNGIHSVQRFSALDGESLKLPENWIHTRGAYGCLRSHLQVVRNARELSAPYVLIFEDDVAFADHLEKKFSLCMDQLPPDWDMLFFGALHRDEPIKVADNIARITKAYSTYAYALRNTVFDDFIELNRQSDQELDNNNLVLQQRFKCYCFMPHLAWVESDHSDAQERLVDHWYLRESLVLFGSQVDQLLRQTTVIFAHGDHDGVGRTAENLMYLIHYFDKFFTQNVEMVIVEQGAQPTIDSASLPINCKHVFLRDDGPFNREHCFITGLSQSDPARKFVILSDNDICLETLDIRANLRMCERYDYVTGFSSIHELSREDSSRLRNTQSSRGIDITKNSVQNHNRKGYCRFLKREAIQVLGEGSDAAFRLALEPEPTRRVFHSPNYALRLRQD
jgi:glycosyl transferase family 25